MSNFDAFRTSQLWNFASISHKANVEIWHFSHTRDDESCADFAHYTFHILAHFTHHKLGLLHRFHTSQMTNVAHRDKLIWPLWKLGEQGGKADCMQGIEEQTEREGFPCVAGGY